MLFERRTCALLIAATIAPIAATAFANPAEEGDRATITVRLGATYRQGAMELTKGSDGVPLSIGETRTITLKAAFEGSGLVRTASIDAAAGTVTTTTPLARGGVVGGIVAGAPGTPPPPPPPAGQGGVTGGIVAGRPAASPAPPGSGGVAGAIVTGGVAAPLTAEYVWTVRVRLVSIAPDAVTFNVTWSRTGQDGPAEGDERTIKLRPDERHLLDFLPTDDKGVANLFVEVWATRVENPAYANLAISYDMWLVHETASGEKITRRVNVAGGQGDAVKFSFYPILFPVDARQPFDGDHGPVRMLVRGLITGRAKGDGTIELVVRTERTVGPVSRQGRLPGEIGGGEKIFVVRSDETTSIELPPSEAMFSVPVEGEKPATLRPGVETAPNGWLHVTQRQFLAGTKTSLVISLRGGYGGIVSK